MHLNLNFFEMPQNSLPTASVSFGKLCGGLFAFAVCLPYFLRIKPSAAIKLSAASMAFVALFAVSAAVPFDLF
ncbi:Uncharacterised protein [Neisseria flavescens]|jgi:hypothetical protein|uniref:Uncharacterized protein n=2 Tax=Neisseriaceae TaxID=481 RepID=C0EN65_NEIFL|nr:hypothetical protein NEIFLAOT_01399 [Neisseria flavescens NRL30031/H210]SPY01271.1 Uncharacterised protein [Neisseria meningitidis]STZ66248.1 Uncharacterised protein [Neisseria flavescens]VTX94007.1 Uncharacterised protein [Neisseria subflava]SPY01379.1 Uncharacterised protein [Neisseria meningitidis]